MSEVKKSTRRVALYRKYRPRKLSDIIGQPQVTEILASVEKNRNFSHAYLFTGQRGTGKTSAARILAHLINQSNYASEKSDDIDIIEIDAASQSRVDDVRELRDNVQLAPMSHAHKIYIIDEVHMLSNAAFNALLKTIEEPPAHVIFILATTEVHKLPSTILSRVQRFQFQPVDPSILHKHLRKISNLEKISISNEALDLIVEHSGGSVRDSLTLLDQLSTSHQEISQATVEQVLGVAPNSIIREIISATEQNNLPTVLEKIQQLLECGENAKNLSEQLAKKLAENALQNPQIFRLIDQILEVKNSNLPELKLQSVFANFILEQNPNNSTNYTKKPQKPEILAQTTTEKNKKIAKQNIENANENSEQKLENENFKNPKIAKEIAPPRENPEKKDIKVEKKEEKSNKNPAKKNDKEVFNWSDFLETIRENNAPTAAILSQANYDFDGEKLTLYFAKKIYREQIKRTKYQKILSLAFFEIYHFEPEIYIANGAKMAIDSENDVLKNVAAIMNGGEIIKEAK